MSGCPTFYFSSKKENPKTNVRLNIKNNSNNEPVIEFNSDLILNITIEGIEYIMDIALSIKIDNDSEPTVNITHEINTKSGSKPIANLLTFMNDFKNKISDQLNSETIKLQEIEKGRLKMKELLKLDESIKETQKQKEVDEQRRIEREQKQKELEEQQRIEG